MTAPPDSSAEIRATLGRRDLSPAFGRVAACVLTYNRKEMVLGCLAAIKAQTRPVDLVVVLDNGSTDGTRKALADAGHFDTRGIDFVRYETNVGPAGGFNAVMQRGYESGCEWLWVMDDDVLPASNALEELARAYEICFATPESVGFLVSKIETPDGRPNNVPSVDNRQDTTNQPEWAEFLEHGLVRVAWSTMNSILIPRSTFRDFGFSKPDFFYGGDDIDFTMRVVKERCGYIVGKSRAVHLRESSGSFHPLNERNPSRIPLYFYFYRSQVYLRREHMGRKELFFFLLKIARDLVGVLRRGSNRFRMARTILAGAVAGFFFNPRNVSVPER